MILPSSKYSGKNKKKSSGNLSPEDLQALVEVASAQGDGNAISISSLEEYLTWYLNIYGQIALEIFIEDCKKALREKDYKKLLEVISTMQSRSKNFLEVEVESPTPEKTDLTPERLNTILEEYEIYFNELGIEEFVKEEGQNFDETGHVSFSQVVELVGAFESQIENLVKNGDLEQEKAEEIIAELKEIEVGKFSSLGENEIEEIIEKLPHLDAEEINAVIQDIGERENLELVESSKIFGEAGFVSFDENLNEWRNSTADKNFAEINEVQAQFEAELVHMVETGKITSDQAYELRDKFVNAPVEQVEVIGDEIYSVLQNDQGLDQNQFEQTVNKLVERDYLQIVQEHDPKGNDFLNESLSTEGVTQDIPAQTVQQLQDVDQTARIFDEAGFISLGEKIEPPSLIEQGITEPITTPVGETVVTETFTQVPPTPAVQQQPAATQPTVQTPPADTFVPVEFFAPGTRPASQPSTTPNFVTDVTPNLVTQPHSFAKPDVPAVQPQQVTQQQLEVEHPTQTFQQPDAQQVQQPQAEQPQQKMEPTSKTQQSEPQRTEPEQKVEEITYGRRPNEPEEMDFNKGPCKECNTRNCTECGISPNGDKLAQAIQERAVARGASSTSIAPTVAPPIAPPIVGDQFGSDFQVNNPTREMGSRTLTNAGLSR